MLKVNEEVFAALQQKSYKEVGDQAVALMHRIGQTRRRAEVLRAAKARTHRDYPISLKGWNFDDFRRRCCEYFIAMWEG